MGKGRRREATALVIGQPEAASRPLFLEDAVLLHQVLDDALLVAVDPSREGHEQHPQRGGVGPHWPTLPGVGERVRDPGRVSGQYGLANRLVPRGQALSAAVRLAHELARFPQRRLRSDRLLAHEQWSLAYPDALRNELRRGLEVIGSGETQYRGSRLRSRPGPPRPAAP